MSVDGPRLPDYLEYSREPTADELELLARLDAAMERRDVALIGTAYVERLRRDLEALRIGAKSDDIDDSPVEYWVNAVLREGEHPSTGKHLDAELWFDVVVAAAEATQDEDEAWCIGDGPADLLVGDHPQAMDWFHAARTTHTGVERRFQAMHADHELMALHAGWWTDRS